MRSRHLSKIDTLNHVVFRFVRFLNTEARRQSLFNEAAVHYQQNAMFPFNKISRVWAQSGFTMRLSPRNGLGSSSWLGGSFVNRRYGTDLPSPWVDSSSFTIIWMIDSGKVSFERWAYLHPDSEEPAHKPDFHKNMWGGLPCRVEKTHIRASNSHSLS